MLVDRRNQGGSELTVDLADPQRITYHNPLDLSHMLVLASADNGFVADDCARF